MVETRRVLLVDDDPDAVKLAVSLLRDEPYRLLWATDAHSALELARLHTPDAIVLSWALSDMTGDELAELLALDSVTARIPLILFSLEPWLFGEEWRDRAAQVVNKTYINELLPRLRDVLGLSTELDTDPVELARIRDRSLWWEGEEEGDWRPFKRQLLALVSSDAS